MLQISLTRTDGNRLEFTLPETPSELTLSQKLDFEFAQFELIDYLKKYSDELFERRAEYILILAKGLSEVLQIDLSIIMNLPGISILETTYQDLFDHVEYLNGKGSKVSKAQLEESLVSIWNHFNLVINQTDENIKPEITYKGITYKLPEIVKHPLNGSDVFKSLTVKQAIEIIQVNNKYSTFLKQNKGAEHTEADKTWIFSKSLSEIALMLEPENIPYKSEDGFNTWLNERMLFWQDIDWQTYHYIDLWFSGYIKQLKEDNENKYFFESSYQSTTPEEREAQYKARAKSDLIYQNVGVKTIIPKLLEMDAFTPEPGQSKYEATMKAPFTDAVKLISNDNAGGE